MQHQHPAASVAPNPAWGDLQARLLPGENVRGSLEVDLDGQLRFAAGLLALTERRLLAWYAADGQWRDWPLQPALRLQISDQSGVGLLELVDEQIGRAHV